MNQAQSPKAHSSQGYLIVRVAHDNEAIEQNKTADDRQGQIENGVSRRMWGPPGQDRV